jgi:hypothetical protein
MLVHLCVALSREYVTLEHMLVESLVACPEFRGERFFADLEHGVLKFGKTVEMETIFVEFLGLPQESLRLIEVSLLLNVVLGGIKASTILLTHLTSDVGKFY